MLLRFGGYLFKRAETEDEFEQIHALNYRTFVNEIAQYADQGGGRLIDKFHHKNIYFIAIKDGQVVGMVSVHGQPPFSIADRLADPSILNRPDINPLEVRLLAIDQEKRGTLVFAGLVYLMYVYAEEMGATHLFISGVAERLSIYQELGFEPLGPAVQAGKATFLPMVNRVADIRSKKLRTFEAFEKRLQRRDGSEGENGEPPAPSCEGRLRGRRKMVCLLPGPVTIAPSVHAAFHRAPIYHRGSEFLELYEKVRGQLARLTRSRNVAILNGSGTLANEAVAATLASEPAPTRGLLLVNGEFGQRLVRQATRFGLAFDTLTWRWGEPWDLQAVERKLTEPGRHFHWVWGVHQESSTGVLNDLRGLTDLGLRYDCRVCVDCISSLGAVPLDLSEVYLASGATGKALGSYAGAALLFADARRLEHLQLEQTPNYLDLPAAFSVSGPRFTFPSSTLFALEAALDIFSSSASAALCFERYRRLGQFVRSQLRALDLPPLADERCAAPVITTFAPPHGENSDTFVARCEAWGYALGGASGYLQDKRFAQIATMGAIKQDDFAPLFDHLRDHLSAAPARRRSEAEALAP